WSSGRMSAVGQTETSTCRSGTSGLPPIADIATHHGQVRFVPNRDIVSFDHFVGTQDKARRDIKADLVGGPQIDDKLEPARLFDRDVARACPLQYFDKLPTQ